MLVQFLVEEGDSEVWKDLYIKEEMISAMYVLDEYDDIVNVLYDGTYMSFKRIPKLIKYLEKEFIYA